MNNIIRFIRRDDYTMTENIFKKIQNSSALDLLRDNGISINPPINIGLLLKKMNIQYFGANFNEVEKKNGLSYLSWAWAWGEIKKLYPIQYPLL